MKLSEIRPDFRPGDIFEMEYENLLGKFKVTSVTPLKLTWLLMEWDTDTELNVEEEIDESDLNNWSPLWKLNEACRVEQILNNYNED